MIKLCTASAGAGKTHKLAGEYIGLLFGQPKAYRHILAVTFTNKATDEMKQRILQELHILSVDCKKSDYLKDLLKSTSLSCEEIQSEAKKILVSILHDYSAFYISTIDKFFQMVMRSFARELGRMATYEVELDVESVLVAAIDRMYADLDDHKSGQLLDWLINFSLDEVDKGDSWDIRKKIISLSKAIFSEQFKIINNSCECELSTSEVGKLKESLLVITKNIEIKYRKIVKQGLDCISAHGLEVTSFKGASRSPFVYFEKALALRKGILEPTQSFLKLQDNISAWSSKSNVNEIEAIYPQLNEIVSQICDFFSQNGEYSDYLSAKAILGNVNIMGILGDVNNRIMEFCKEKNLILISESTELLNKIIDGSDTPFIYEKIGTTINNFMLDEFQDTSAMQWDNFYPLISNSVDAGYYNLIVGDVKQSIYRWRNSDLNILAKQIRSQFRQEQIIDDPMEENWRSGREIIEFNNSFFTHCAQVAQNNFSVSDETPITDVYSALVQGLPQKRKDARGYVKVKFFEKPQGEEDSLVYDNLCAEIENLKGRGYLLSDIAILTRTNNEGANVVNCLIKNGYDVISGDSLFICSSSAVTTVVNILREIDNPDSSILNIYKKYMDIPLVSNEKGDSLYQLCESIIRDSLNSEQKEDIAYLQAFLDLVLTYTLKEGTNISQFLKWWDEFGVKKTISAPEDINAIKVLTIHKSKGLAFKVTIIPFFKESLDHSSLRSPILWNKYSYSKDGNNMADIAVPVKYSSGLGKTCFAQSYMKEKLSTCIDAINVAYVAFTRAKQELVIYAQLPDFKQDGSYTKKSVSDILYSYCVSELEDGCYQLGEPLHSNTKQKESSVFEIKGAFEFAKHTDIMKSALGSGSIKDGETIREWGIAMHYVFSLITHSMSVENAVKKAIEYGVADCSYNQLLEMVTGAMDKAKEYDWFNPKYEVYNECTIINTDGNIRRPDRVIVYNNSATVIDYKFGAFSENSIQLENYKKQVRAYMNLLLRMDFKPVKGFLWYPLDNKIIEI